MAGIRWWLSEFANCCLCRSHEEEAKVTVSSRASGNLRAALQRCPALSERFELSCITRFTLASLVPCASPGAKWEQPIRRDEIDGLPDGGLVAVDWVGTAAAATGLAGGDVAATIASSSPPTALVLMLPGTGTNSRRGFACTIAHRVASLRPDFHVGVVVLQGHDGLPLRSDKVMSTAYVGCGDAGYVFEHVSTRFPGVPIVVFTCSIGSAHFTRWLGTASPESVQKTGIVGAIMLSHGHSGAESAVALKESPACESFILGEWRRILRESPPDPAVLARKAPKFDISRVLRAKTHAKWDEEVLPLYGFTDNAEMHRQCDATPSMLANVKMPLVFVNTDNDPITPAGRLMDTGRVCDVVPNCAAVRTRLGSHMAWWQGPPWALEQRWAYTTMCELIVAIAEMPRG
eukprot:TRINITY_DN49602_c0_g1_i1.p1 TRINITY_DN49602_c0_g1~~TRINITY_DN49602_c0_g1_i1.p1  ORF type:complete len:430 (+),score=51.92 TRINITY_DN49602_c0_g1_i1:79-1290(+)